MGKLILKELPKCYGIKLAEDLANWKDIEEYSVYIQDIILQRMSLEIFVSTLQSIAQKEILRFFEVVIAELEKDRGRGMPCKVCEFISGCLYTASMIHGNESHWADEE